MNKYLIMVSILVTQLPVMAEEIRQKSLVDRSGCYVKEAMIRDPLNNKKVRTVTWLKITRMEINSHPTLYNVVGHITGAHLNVCSIGSEQDPISMKLNNDRLEYQKVLDWRENNNSIKAICRFRIKWNTKGLMVKELGDEFYCTKLVFGCGNHIALNDLTFLNNEKTKMKFCNDLLTK